MTTTVRDVQNGSLKPIGSFATNYTYSSTPAAENTYDAQLLAANIAYQIPIEQSVVYNDFGGAPLKTDTKTWLDQFLMSSETVALNDGSTSENIYSYYPNGQLETEMEYDYGANAPGALLRKTVFNYQGFPAAPIFPTYGAILDRPCQVVTFDKSGTNRVAETDYYYDGGTTLCGTAGTPSVSAVTSLTGHDETNYAHTSTAPRGNVTQESRQIIQLSTAATSTYAYDETGQVKSATDPRGNTTGYSYADSYASGFGTPPGQTNAYLTQLTLPNTGSPAVNHVEKFTYRYDDGQLASSSDQNSAPNYTDYIYADPLGRLTGTDYPDSGKTTVTYNDTASPPTVVTKRLLGGSTYLTSTTVLDGAGHAIQSQLNSDPSGTDNTNTVYDGLGRVFSVSNPYRSTNDSTYGITLYTYDGLGRTTNVTTPDGAIASTSYSGPKTTVTDQAGRQRTMTADALGRIKQVVEDPGSPVCSLTVPQPCHFNYSTSYTYDALDDLTGVNQSNSLTRTFTYDSLKRLTQAINPESGTINYTYDLNGNLFTKTDAHPTTITYGYDALNRITGKQYSDKTPAVSYTYDLGVNGIGLLSSVANGSSTTNYLSFDALGRVLASNQVTGSQTYPFSYTYNLAGSVMTETYPSGRTITTGYDGANRPDAVTGVMSGAQTNYVAGVSYAPAGGPTLYQYGNNLWRQISYNNRLQMSGFIDLVNNSTGSELLNVGLTWGTTNNNGNLQSAAYKNGGPGYPVFLTFNETYSYDALNRLTSAGDSGWSRSFGYDAFGNMWVTANSGITLAGNTPTTDVFNANNQIAGTSYDAAGNQTLVNGDTQAYDAENRQISSTFAGASETYLYDGNGQRVEKSGAIGATVFVYDAMGKLAAEYSTAANASPCTTCYLSADHLGSTRLVTDSKANVIGRHDYLPFGEEIAAGMAGRNGQWGAGNDTVNQKFTGKERDQESGLDYFGSRYYGSALGRWVSPDRVNLTEDRLVSPTNTLNKYVYGGNNPLKFVDPDGEDITLFYTNGGPGGHAMLLAYDQSNGNSAVQSFGPANHSNSTELEMAVGIPVPGTANYGFADIKSADELRQDYSTVTIQTSPEETEKAIQYIKNHSDGNYNTYTNNCTTTCARILRLLNLHAWGEFIPRSLFDNVVDQYSHTAPKTNMPWTEQHGRDYGNPRPGYNAFDLLFLSIQNQQQAAKKPKEVVKSKICFNDDNGNQSCSSGN